MHTFRQLPDLVLCGLKCGPACQKQLRKRRCREGAVEKPKLHNAPRFERRLFHGSGREHKETTENAGKSWRYRWRRLCYARWERRSVLKSRGKPTTKPKSPTKSKRQSMHASWAAHESTSKRLESTLSQDHEDHIAERGFNSTSHYNLVHKFVPMPQAMKNPDAKAAMDKEWKKLKTLPAWQLDKVKSKKRGHSGSTRREKESPFCYIDGLLSPQGHGIRTTVSKTQRTRRAPRRHCRRRFRFWCRIH